MFFIAGTKGTTKTAGKGEFYCPVCQTSTRYLHRQVHKKATVFFVPVINLKLLGEYVECQSCNGTFNMEILEYDPQEEQQSVESLYRQGIKRVMTIMMIADGKIKESEVEMMRDIYRKVLGDELLDRELEEEVDFCTRSPIDIEGFLENLYPYLNEYGREMIFKISYYVAIADSKYSSEEEKILNKIGKTLQLSPAHIKGIVAEINE